MFLYDSDRPEPDDRSGIWRARAKLMVRVEGLEPPKLSPPEPKSGVSTSSTTPASGAEPPKALARGLYITA
jgi:hypothetical protein